MDQNDAKERAREALRTRIVEAARDIVSQEGLDALSMRALAEHEEVNVEFTAGGHGISGSEARLPQPGRELPPEDVALVRGCADALALRMRYHNPEVHARQQPAPGEAREVFDAVEQARYEALGMRRFGGCADNLDAALVEHLKSSGLNRARGPEEIPLSEALRLMTRERVSGRPLPPEAKRLVETWKPHLDPEALQDLSELSGLAGDQHRYAQVARRLLQHLSLELPDDQQPLLVRRLRPQHAVVQVVSDSRRDHEQKPARRRQSARYSGQSCRIPAGHR